MADSEDIDTYFEDAMRIHAICADYRLSENDARLLTYIHTKSKDSGRGIDYFRNPAPEDSEALEIMLGNRSGALRIPPVMALDTETQDALDLILSISDKIAHFDSVLAAECGLENRLSGELRQRLRLYKDSAFRDRMVFLYKNVILTQIDAYDGARIKQSFERWNHEKSRQEDELMTLAGIAKHTD